ncbi:MAG TPA: ROK family protein, partial [Fervidobacterium sp.]|nr:ROK family protein [Fervidobacterium sp.]HUM43657.1 ROK family protein [Fervidobacterium sp.]
LCMNPAYGNILGVKIGLGYLQLIIANLTGEIVTKQRIDFGESSEPVKISKLIKQFVDDRNNNHLVGASVAVSGTVDSSNGIVLDSFILRWKNVKFGEMLSKQLKVPVYIMNDVDSFTTTHLWKGKLRKHSNALVITLGTGIGGSLIVNGELYTGNGGAGEVGHMTVYENGNRCNCGSLGCLEAEAGFEALVNKIYKKTKNKTLLEDYRNFQNTEMSEMDFIKLALKEDLKATREVFEEYSMLVGIALKNLINIFAPEYLLIGGEALEFSEHFLEKAINYARKNAFGNLGKRVTFDVDDFGEEAWTLGGVYKVIQEEMFAIKV